MGLILDASSQQFNLTLNAETLAVTSAKLPEIEADTPRTLFEERITLMRDLWAAIDSLFETFLKRRTTGAWESQTVGIRKWILQTPRPAVAVA